MEFTKKILFFTLFTLAPTYYAYPMDKPAKPLTKKPTKALTTKALTKKGAKAAGRAIGSAIDRALKKPSSKTEKPPITPTKSLSNYGSIEPIKAETAQNPKIKYIAIQTNETSTKTELLTIDGFLTQYSDIKTPLFTQVIKASEEDAISVKKAGRLINALACTDKKWNESIKKNYLEAIHSFSKKFDTCDAKVCVELLPSGIVGTATEIHVLHQAFFKFLEAQNNLSPENTSKIVTDFIKAGADINFTYGSNSHVTPIIIATHSENLAKVNALIASGADLKKPNKLGKTPLQYAQELKNPEIAEVIQDAIEKKRK
jgi:hypothetical protein